MNDLAELEDWTSSNEIGLLNINIRWYNLLLVTIYGPSWVHLRLRKLSSTSRNKIITKLQRLCPGHSMKRFVLWSSRVLGYTAFELCHHLYSWKCLNIIKEKKKIHEIFKRERVSKWGSDSFWLQAEPSVWVRRDASFAWGDSPYFLCMVRSSYHSRH